jgi:hypothetical protein
VKNTLYPKAAKRRINKTVATPLGERSVLAKSVDRSEEISSPKPTLAKFEQRTVNPQTLRANASTASTNLVPTEAVFVVMQGQSDGNSGSAYWTVCVWRVTISNSRSGNINNAGIPAKKI